MSINHMIETNALTTTPSPGPIQTASDKHTPISQPHSPPSPPKKTPSNFRNSEAGWTGAHYSRDGNGSSFVTYDPYDPSRLPDTSATGHFGPAPDTSSPVRRTLRHQIQERRNLASSKCRNSAETWRLAFECNSLQNSCECYQPI